MAKVTVASVKVAVPKSPTAVPGANVNAGGTVQRSYHAKPNLSGTAKIPAISMMPPDAGPIKNKIPPMSGPYFNT